MLTQHEIIDAMQFEFFNARNPINGTGDPAQVITYQFAGNTQPDDLPANETWNNWRGFTAAERAHFEQALAHYESVLNVEFVEVTGENDPDLNVGAATIPGSVSGYGGWSGAYDGNNNITQLDGFVVFERNLDMSDPAQMYLILHELGHALGLRHTHDAPDLPHEFDSNLYSVMSYDINPVNGQLSNALMLFDVLALQDIWGAAEFNGGDTTYTGPRTTTVDAIWDSGGTDLIDASAQSGAVTLDLREGSFSDFDSPSDIVITYGTVIENAIGGLGNDQIIGNDARNLLRGGEGEDHLVGGGQNDTLRGQKGMDRLEGGDFADQLFGNKGRDVLLGGNGRDKLTGGAQMDTLRGGNGNDTLKGGSGQDRLDGGRGNDLLNGGRGVDTFIFGTQGGEDRIVDFTDNEDRLEIRGYGSRAEVLAAASDDDGAVLFDFGTALLRVEGMTLGTLADDLFV